MSGGVEAHAGDVEVVMAVFDRADLVTDAVGSVLAQTLPPRRLHVVDDGSTDGTAEVLDRLAETDDRIHVTHQPNTGPAAARNRGLADCTATYVAFCDSDDLMPPDRLEWQRAHLLAEPGCDAVIGIEEIAVAPGVEPPASVAGALEATTPHWSFPSLFTTRRVLVEHGGFDESMRIGEDVDLVLRLTAAGLRVDYVDRLAVHRRILGDNLSYEDAHGEIGLLRLLRHRLAARRPADRGTKGQT